MECGVLYRYNAKLESKGISRRKHKGDAYWMRRSYVGYNEVFLTGIRPNKLGLLKKDWGEIGEKKLKSGKKQAVLWGFCPFSGNFRGKATASDSVMRVFESLHPSHFESCYLKTIIALLFYADFVVDP